MSDLNLVLRITAQLNEAARQLTELQAELRGTGETASAASAGLTAATQAETGAATAAEKLAETQRVAAASVDELRRAQTEAKQAAAEALSTQQALERAQANDNKKQETAAQEAAAAAAAKHAAEVDKLRANMDKLLGKIDPTIKKLGELDELESRLAKTRKAGLIDDSTYSEYTQKIESQRAILGTLSDDLGKFSLGTKTARREVLQLTRQLASGDLPRASNTILSLSNRIGLLSSGLSAAVVAASATTAALVGVAYIVKSILNDQERYNAAIITTGRSAGVTSGQLEMMARRTGELRNNYADVRHVLAGLVDTGRFTTSLNSVSEAAVSLMELTGRSADDVVKEFTRARDSVSDWAIESNKQYHWLDLATYQRISALEQQGRTEEALELAAQEFAKASSERANELYNELNWVAQGWNKVKQAVAGALQVAKGEVSSTLRLESDEEFRAAKIAELQQVLANAGDEVDIAVKGESYQRYINSVKSSLAALQAEQKAVEENNQQQAAQKKANAERIAAQKELENTWKNNRSELEKEADAIDKLNDSYRKLWADAAGRDKLELRGVTSSDGLTFAGGQYDRDVAAIGQASEKSIKQFITQQERSLALRDESANLARVEYEISNGTLQNATREQQETARANAQKLDAIKAQQKASKAAASETKKSAAETERWLKSLENKAKKTQPETWASRLAEMSQHNLTEQQSVRAGAANAQITAESNKKSNQSLNAELAQFDISRALDAKKDEIQTWYQDTLAELQGNNNAAGVDMLEQLLPLKTAQAELEDVQRQMDALRQNLSTGEQQIQAQVNSGLITEIEGRQQLVALHQQTAAEIEKYFPLLQQLAEIPGAMGDSARAALAQLQVQASELKNTADHLSTAFKDGLQGGIESSLLGLSRGTYNLAGAVKNLAKTIIDSLAQIAAQQLASAAMNGLGMAGGTGGLLASLFMADGGLVSGPGTATSDSIPARLSDGEYVVNAAAVNRYGAGFFDALNRQRVSHFADGGIVRTVPAQSSPSYQPTVDTDATGSQAESVQPLLQQTLVFDAGEAMQAAMKSLSGQRALMTFIRANAPTIRQDLGVKNG